MRPLHAAALAPLLALALPLGGPRDAEACSPPICWPGAIVPAGGEVPANAPGLYWKPLRERSGPDTDADPANLTLTRQAAPATPIAFTAEPLDRGAFLIVPDEPLVPGRYTLTDATTCSRPEFGGAPSSTFVVVPAAPLPTELGVLTVVGAPARGSIAVATASGPCELEIDAVYVDLELAPAAGAQAWLGVLHFQTLVDGAPWSPRSVINYETPPGASWRGRARDRVFHTCASADPFSQSGVAAGTHVVTMQATLPGSDVVVASTSVTVELACTPARADGDGCSTSAGAATWPLLALLALLAPAAPRRRRARAPR